MKLSLERWMAYSFLNIVADLRLGDLVKLYVFIVYQISVCVEFVVVVLASLDVGTVRLGCACC